MGYAAMMVHLDVERDCEQRIQFALDLADRFQAALIGVAGLELRPAFAAAGLAVYAEPGRSDMQQATASFDEMGTKFLTQGQQLKSVEWRTALEAPADVLAREARAADLIIVGPRRPAGNHHDAFDPGAVLLRAGRPILVAPDIFHPLALRRVVVAWKDTRECRRAVYDALPFLQQAKEVLILEIGEDGAESDARKALSDVASYLARHQVVVTDAVWQRARGPAASELLHFVKDKRADLIVAGGYGHSRLGEWIFGGVTDELLSASPVCCMLSH
jgi:nucleotide-binding universal stress UspA family protein